MWFTSPSSVLTHGPCGALPRYLLSMTLFLSSPLYSPPCLLFITLHAPNYTSSLIYLSPSTFAPKCNLYLPPYSFTSLIVPNTFCPDICCPTHPFPLLCSSSKKSVTASSCLALHLPLNHCSHLSLQQIFLSNSTNVSFPCQNPLQSNIYCSKSLYLVMSVQHSCTPFLFHYFKLHPQSLVCLHP